MDTPIAFKRVNAGFSVGPEKSDEPRNHEITKEDEYSMQI